MSLLFVDNFQAYGTDEDAMLDGVWAVVSPSNGSAAGDVTLQDDPDPLISTKVLRFNTSSSGLGAHVRHVISQGGQSTFGVGMRFWLTDLPSVTTTAPYISFRDTDNNIHCQLFVNTDGTLSFYRGGSENTGGDVGGSSGSTKGTLLGTSTLPVITTGAWHHIELRVAISDSAGTLQVYVDETEVAGLTLSSLDTKDSSNTTITQVVVGASGASGGTARTVMYMKDYWEWNTSGSLNNTFIGSKGVYWLPPTADASLNWTPSTGATGYNLIDESGPSETDYISADDSPPAAAEFNLQDLPAEITSVYGVMILTRAWKTDAGDAQLQMGLKGTLEADGSDRTITGAATYWTDISETSPDTAAAWTPSQINAVKLTADRTV